VALRWLELLATPVIWVALQRKHRGDELFLLSAFLLSDVKSTGAWVEFD
jgi:hypothetical protein